MSITTGTTLSPERRPGSGIPAIPAYPMPDATDLPANTAGWTVDRERAVLLLHDMQRYFLAPFPPPLRDPLVANAARLRAACAAACVPVAYTAQPGDMTPAEFLSPLTVLEF